MTLIDDLKAKKQQLTEALAGCTDAKAYDLIDADLREVTKSLTLAENQEKKRLADEAAAKHKKALDDFAAEKQRIEKVKQDADKQDVLLFEKIQGVYDAYSKAYDTRMQIIEDTRLLQRTAAELQLEAPKNEYMRICNFSDNQGDKREFFSAMITQYTKAIGVLYGAHKRGEKAPDRPGMDWYYRGGGQFYPAQQQGKQQG